MTKIELAHCFFGGASRRGLGADASSVANTHSRINIAKRCLLPPRRRAFRYNVFGSKQRPQTVSVSILCHVEFSIGFYHDKNLVWSVEVDMFWASFWRVGEPASLVNHVSFAIL